MNEIVKKISNSKNTKRSPDNDNSEGAVKPADHLPDAYALSQALMNAYQQSQPLFMNMVERYNKDLSHAKAPAALPTATMDMAEEAFDMFGSMAANPMRYWSMQMNYAQKQMDLWQNSMRKFSGEEVSPIIEPQKGDRRFKADEWNDSAMFDFIKQYYLLACDFVNETIESTEGLDPAKKDKMAFNARLFMDALSPSNFAFTNPEVLNETIRTGGDNLVRGLQNLNHDLERGNGELKISMSDPDAFTLGENIATTAGHVVYENDLMQLIQYEPQTTQVLKKPLLIVPPWINKYYILDLREDNSFINWAVQQGHTVFCISWVNPDTKLAQKTFDDYMNEGVLEALDQIEDITGEESCNAVGYCLGGTLLTTTMAYLAAKKQSKRISSASLFTTLVDFEKAGDIKMFMGDQQIEAMEKAMRENGVFSGAEMQKTFSLLRANDLIWSFAVNNYLMGKEPFPFDLLHWNDDPTNMPAAMHCFYLKNMYRDNKLVEPGGVEMDGVKIDISKIKTPCYFLSTREDHIAPWEATYRTTQMVGGPKTFTLAASGHVAGVINPPSKNKYCFWSADDAPEDHNEWLDSAKENEGSWWPNWQNWVEGQADERVKARPVKRSIEAAPGRYVRARSD